MTRWVRRRSRWAKSHRAVRSDRPRRLWARARWTEARRTAAYNNRSAVSRIVADRKARRRQVFRRGGSQKRAAERICRSERVLGFHRVRRGGKYFSRGRAPFAAVARPPPRRVANTSARPRCPAHQRQARLETIRARTSREPIVSHGRLPSTGFTSMGISHPSGRTRSKRGTVMSTSHATPDDYLEAFLTLLPSRVILRTARESGFIRRHRKLDPVAFLYTIAFETGPQLQHTVDTVERHSKVRQFRSRIVRHLGDTLYSSPLIFVNAGSYLPPSRPLVEWHRGGGGRKTRPFP